MDLVDKALEAIYIWGHFQLFPSSSEVPGSRGRVRIPFWNCLWDQEVLYVKCLTHSKAVPTRDPELSPDPGLCLLFWPHTSSFMHPILYATYLFASYIQALLRLFPLPGRSILWSLWIFPLAFKGPV